MWMRLVRRWNGRYGVMDGFDVNLGSGVTLRVHTR